MLRELINERLVRPVGHETYEIQHDRLAAAVIESMKNRALEKTTAEQGKREESRHKLRAFLCHSSPDKMVVRELYQRLIRDGFYAWLDEEDLIPGQEWDIEIRRAVRESDVVVVCLSRSSITKEGYVQKEIRYALDVAAEKPPGIIFLIPARLDECDVPERLKQWHWVDLFKDKGYERLTKALYKRGETLGAVPLKR